MPTLTAAQVLACKTPGDLFTTPANLRAEYLALTKIWHPDLPSGNPEVMAHINRLHQQAESSPIWTSTQNKRLVIKKSDGTTIFRYNHHTEFELGHMYYAKHNLVFLIEDKYSSLVSNAVDSIGKIKFPSKNFADVLGPRLLHRPNQTITLPDGRHFLGYNKQPDIFLLADCPVNRDPRHIAWILNRIYDLICSLHFGDVTHNNITLSSVLISPKNHVAHLFSFFYAAIAGAPISFLPRLAHSICPPDIKLTKRAAKTLDLAMIKALGRELAGDRTGMTLPSTPTFNFLRGPTTGSAVEDYQGWSNALTAEFGPERKFHSMDEPQPVP